MVLTNVAYMYMMLTNVSNMYMLFTNVAKMYIVHSVLSLKQFVEKGHRTGRVATHQCCWGGTWYVTIEDQEMKDKLGM